MKFVERGAITKKKESKNKNMGTIATSVRLEICVSACEKCACENPNEKKKKKKKTNKSYSVCESRNFVKVVRRGRVRYKNNR